MLRWLLRVSVLLFGAALLTFTLIRLAPGDPIAIMMGSIQDQAVGNTLSTDMHTTRLRTELGLDQPVPVQFGHWLIRMIQLDFGTSFRSRQPVSVELARRLPATVMLAGAACVLHAFLALFTGGIAALWSQRWTDHATRLAAVILAATPGFVLAWLGLKLFTTHLPWYQLTGPASLARLWLPALVLGLLYTPALMRVVRVSLLNEMNQLYMLFGTANGLGRIRLVVTYALRNALLPIMALFGTNIAGLLSGAVVIETIFSWPGIGRYAVESVLARDYPVVQGYVLLITVFVVLTTSITELLNQWLDPRLRQPKRPS